MLLYEMLTEYVFHTTPTVSLNWITILLQLFVQSYTSAYVMMEGIRRRQIIEKITLIAMPMVLCITFVCMNLILGGCFLNGGFKEETRLIAFLCDSEVVSEIIGILLLFPALSLIVEIIRFRSEWKKGWIVRWLSFSGMLLNFATYIICLLPTISLVKDRIFILPGDIKFPAEKLVLYYTYAVYNLLFQVILKLLVIILHFALSYKEIQGDIVALSYEPEWCEKQIRRFFQDGYKVCAISFGQFVLFFYAILINTWYEEGYSLELILKFHIFMIPLDILVLVCLWRIGKPSSIPALKQFKKWNRSSLLKRQFCIEFLNPKNPPIKGYQVWETEHFILAPAYFFKKLYYLPDFLQIEEKKNTKEICFRDGSKIKQNKVSPMDWQLICKYIQK